MKNQIAKLLPISRLTGLSRKAKRGLWLGLTLVPISRLTRLSWRVKAGLLLGLVLVLVLTASAIYWLMIREAWVEQPVMLRILSGKVGITSQQGDFLEAADETWLTEDTRIRAKENSLAVLQYFEGSAVKIEGPAEVHLSRSRSLKGQPVDTGRSIALDVLRGRVTIAVARQAFSHSLFELRTLNSVGIVQGTMFEVEVDEREAAIWELSQGTVRVGAITVGNDLRAVVALIPLNAGDAIAIPPLPQEWRQDQAILKRLRTTTRDIVRKSVEEGRSDVQVKDASLLASNPETGTAVFRIEKVVKPAITAAAARQLPPDYKATKDEMLAQIVPGLVVAKGPVVKRLFVPALPTPEAWAAPTPTLVRKSPPAYLFSIYDVAKPLGVAIDPVGQRIAVTESGGDHVTRVFDGEGNEIMVLAPPGTVPAERTPSYVAIDSRMGTVYVSDRMRHTIDMYDVNGTYLGAFVPRNNPGISWSPLGLAIDSSDNLYVTEVNKHRIMVFDSSGELKLEFGQEGKGEGELSFPNDVAVDSSGRIYVADSNNFRIQVFDAQGQLLGGFSRGGKEAVGFPRGIEIEGDYLYVVDTFGHMVHVYDIGQGVNPVFAFGGRGVGDGEFNFPNGFALDSTGRLYITDRENNRVQVWSY